MLDRGLGFSRCNIYSLCLQRWKGPHLWFYMVCLQPSQEKEESRNEISFKSGRSLTPLMSKYLALSGPVQVFLAYPTKLPFRMNSWNCRFGVMIIVETWSCCELSVNSTRNPTDEIVQEQARYRRIHDGQLWVQASSKSNQHTDSNNKGCVRAIYCNFMLSTKL